MLASLVSMATLLFWTNLVVILRWDERGHSGIKRDIIRAISSFQNYKKEKRKKGKRKTK